MTQQRLATAPDWTISSDGPRPLPYRAYPRVHFYPFQARPAVLKSGKPLANVVTSPDGYLSDKDSGGMFYVIRLA